MRKKTKTVLPAPAAPVASPARVFSREEVAACAQGIWEEKGRPFGRDLENWLEAERRLRNGIATPERETRAFADPEVPFNEDNEPTGDLEERLRQAAATATDRSSTSL
jgi:hypothetical protein